MLGLVHRSARPSRTTLPLRLAAGVLLVLLVVALSPRQAGAEIVWSKAGEIYAMHDDGSAARRLIAPADAGMARLRDPMPAPSGATLAFTAETDANKFTLVGLCGLFPYQYSCFTTHFGYNGAGTYTWKSGTVARVSGAPAYCIDCTSTTSEPTPRADGSIVAQFMMCTGWLDGGVGGTHPYACSAAIQSTGGESYDSCTTVSGVSPSRVDPSKVAHVGCKSSGSDALVITGPARAGERVIGCDDDGEQSDPVWSPAGDRVLVSEGGAEPGLWSYATSNSTCFAGDMRGVLVAPAGKRFNDPAYLGADRIIFEFENNLWTIPASCNACAFPAAATQLTTDGADTMRNTDPAWTSDALVVPTGGGGTGSTGGTGSSGAGGSTGTGSGGSGATTSDRTAPVVQLGATKTTQQVGSSSRLTVKLTASEAATVRISGVLLAPGKDPVLSGGPAQAGSGRSVTVKIKLSPAAMRALRKAWKSRRTLKAKLTITVTDAAGNVTTSQRTITLKR